MLFSKKITSEEISRYGVEAAPDRLDNSSFENKKIFDRLVRVVVAQKFNELIDVLVSEKGAENIGSEAGTVAEHIFSKNNPHSITAEQLGAVKKEELSAYMSVDRYRGSEDGVVARSNLADNAQNGIWAIRHSKSGNAHKFSAIPTVAGLYMGHFIAVADMVEGDTVVDVRGNPLSVQNPGVRFSAGDLVRATIDVASKKVWIL